MITDPVAEQMLRKVITQSTIYKNAVDFVLGKDSYRVESFNNVMNIWHDKRISFGDDQYLARSHIAVCHWNENCDREFTSVWQPKNDPRAPRRKKGKKRYKPCTYHYGDNTCLTIQ